MAKIITLPTVWLKDWTEIKKHVLLNEKFNHSEILSLKSDLIVMSALMATYRCQEMD